MCRHVDSMGRGNADEAVNMVTTVIDIYNIIKIVKHIFRIQQIFGIDSLLGLRC